MKRHGLLALVCAFVLATGCATKKIDWNSRVNNYTYDQAVVELGPPDKSAKLTDGSTIAEWYSRRSGPSIGLGTGVGVGPVGVGVGVPLGGSGARVLRLTFGPDGILKTVTK